jgi:hypothetical protein
MAGDPNALSNFFPLATDSVLPDPYCSPNVKPVSLVVLANFLLVDPLDLQYKTSAASVKQVSKRRGENTYTPTSFISGCVFE